MRLTSSPYIPFSYKIYNFFWPSSRNNRNHRWELLLQWSESHGCLSSHWFLVSEASRKLAFYECCSGSTNLFFDMPLYLPRHGALTYCDNADLCKPAAFLNSIHRVGASYKAATYWKHFKAAVDSLIPHERLPYRIRVLSDPSKHLQKNEVVLKHISETFSVLHKLLDIYSGVFAVTPEWSSNGLQKVCIWITSRERIPLDCVEAYPIPLTWETLQVCIVDGVRLLEVRETLQIRLAHASTNSRPKRRKLKTASSKSK